MTGGLPPAPVVAAELLVISIPPVPVAVLLIPPAPPAPELPAVTETLDVVQSIGAPTHWPAWQVSWVVHASPSSQEGPVSSAQVPSAAAPAALEQASQLPASQAVEQQTLSAQKPLWQSEEERQDAPARSRNNSALARIEFPLTPPATSTLPFESAVAVKFARLEIMDDVTVQVLL